MARDGFYFIRGEGHWMKVLGPPQDNYDKDGKEWTFELKPDDAGMELLHELGVADRVNKGENKDRILFRHRAKRADGDPNRPLAVVDADGPHDPSVLIGNGSKVEVKFKYVNNGKGRKDSLYPQGIRIGELVPYERQEFPPVDPEDAFFKKPLEGQNEAPHFEKDFDLEDDEVI